MWRTPELRLLLPSGWHHCDVGLPGYMQDQQGDVISPVPVGCAHDDLWLCGLAHVGKRSVVDGFIECIDRCAGGNVFDVGLAAEGFNSSRSLSLLSFFLSPGRGWRLTPQEHASD